MRKAKLLSLGIFLIVTSILSCNSNPTPEPPSQHKDSVGAAAASTSVRPVHWSYSAEGGPGGWGDLTPVYALCGSGKSQSPINLVTKTGKGTPDWKMEYKTTTLQISHNQQIGRAHV